MRSGIVVLVRSVLLSESSPHDGRGLAPQCSVITDPTHSRRSRCVTGYNKRSVIEFRGERLTAIPDRTNELGIRPKRCYAGSVLVLNPPPDNGSPDDSDENCGHAVDAEVTGCDAFGPSSREDEQDDPQKNQESESRTEKELPDLIYYVS